MVMREEGGGMTRVAAAATAAGRRESTSDIFYHLPHYLQLNTRTFVTIK